MIHIKITHSNEYGLVEAKAENMKEMIDKVLPSVIPNLEKSLPKVKKMAEKRGTNVSDPKWEEKFLIKAKESGWYYDC